MGERFVQWGVIADHKGSCSEGFRLSNFAESSYFSLEKNQREEWEAGRCKRSSCYGTLGATRCESSEKDKENLTGSRNGAGWRGLLDAQDSGSCARQGVEVQVLSTAPHMGF